MKIFYFYIEILDKCLAFVLQWVRIAVDGEVRFASEVVLVAHSEVSCVARSEVCACARGL